MNLVYGSKIFVTNIVVKISLFNDNNTFCATGVDGSVFAGRLVLCIGAGIVDCSWFLQQIQQQLLQVRELKTLNETALWLHHF